MADWLYEATSTQAQLDDTRVMLEKLQAENKNLRRFLMAIVEEKPEKDSKLIKEQRDRFVQIAKTALG